MEITITLASKLGSIVVHAQEYLETGHPYDKIALSAAANDLEVRAWLEENKALMPVKR